MCTKQLKEDQAMLKKKDVFKFDGYRKVNKNRPSSERIKLTQEESDKKLAEDFNKVQAEFDNMTYGQDREILKAAHETMKEGTIGANEMVRIIQIIGDVYALGGSINSLLEKSGYLFHES